MKDLKCDNCKRKVSKATGRLFKYRPTRSGKLVLRLCKDCRPTTIKTRRKNKKFDDTRLFKFGTINLW